MSRLPPSLSELKCHANARIIFTSVIHESLLIILFERSMFSFSHHHHHQPTAKRHPSLDPRKSHQNKSEHFVFLYDRVHLHIKYIHSVHHSHFASRMTTDSLLRSQSVCPPTVVPLHTLAWLYYTTVGLRSRTW